MSTRNPRRALELTCGPRARVVKAALPHLRCPQRKRDACVHPNRARCKHQQAVGAQLHTYIRASQSATEWVHRARSACAVPCPNTVPAAMQTKSTANIAAWSASGSFETPARDFSTVKTPSVLPCSFATIVGDHSEPIARSWRGTPQGQTWSHLAKENGSAVQEGESKRRFALGCKFLAHGIRHLRHKQESRGIHRCCLALFRSCSPLFSSSSPSLHALSFLLFPSSFFLSTPAVPHLPAVSVRLLGHQSQRRNARRAAGARRTGEAKSCRSRRDKGTRRRRERKKKHGDRRPQHAH